LNDALRQLTRGFETVLGFYCVDWICHRRFNRVPWDGI